jgi:isopentenyl-diphosphate delta-isomerase
MGGKVNGEKFKPEMNEEKQRYFILSTEYLDVVNEQDIVIGKETRKKVHEVGLWHRGVHVFLYNEKGEILIQKRSADRSSSPSLLDCSVSEHVQAGESYQDAAIRGLKEELRIKEEIDLKQLVKFRMVYGVNDNEISVIYEAKLGLNNVNFDPIEISEVFYMSMDEIKETIQTERNLFCGWFIEMMNWHLNQETKLEVMK